MIIAIASRKGGVGKTTTAVNLAAALANRDRTLLIDLDSQAAASASLGVARGRLAPSAADVLLHGMPVDKAIRHTTVWGLDLITASVDLLSADGDLAHLRNRDLILAKALAGRTQGYRWVIIDCPPSMGLLTRNALCAADRLVVPVVPHFLAHAGLEQFLEASERLRLRPAGAGELLGIVLTLVDYRLRSTREHVDRLRARYGERVFSTEVRINNKLAQAPESGQTIFQHAPDCVGAALYQALSEELRERALGTQAAGLATVPAASSAPD